MKKLKFTKNIFFLILLLAIVGIMMFFYFYHCGSSNYFYHCATSHDLGIKIDKSIELIDYYDGLGWQDWEYYAIFQLRENQIEALVKSIKKNKNWQKLPFSEEALLIKNSHFTNEKIRQVSSELENGYYFTSKEGSLEKTGILDLNTNKLYFGIVKH